MPKETWSTYFDRDDVDVEVEVEVDVDVVVVVVVVAVAVAVAVAVVVVVVAGVVVVVVVAAAAAATLHGDKRVAASSSRCAHMVGSGHEVWACPWCSHRKRSNRIERNQKKRKLGLDRLRQSVAAETCEWIPMDRSAWTCPFVLLAAGLGEMRLLTKTILIITTRNINRARWLWALSLKDGIRVEGSILEDNVHQQLIELGWTLESGQYRHALLSFKFCVKDQTDHLVWKRTAHYIRESFRAVEFAMYRESGRHEVVNVGEYSPRRRELALKWAAKDPVALMLILGGIQSPLLRYKYRGTQQRCPCCKELAPHWEHLWKCFTKTEIPADGLLLRNLWPRKESDFQLCDMFLEGMKKVGEDC